MWSFPGLASWASSASLTMAATSKFSISILNGSMAHIWLTIYNYNVYVYNNIVTQYSVYVVIPWAGKLDIERKPDNGGDK